MDIATSLSKTYDAISASDSRPVGCFTDSGVPDSVSFNPGSGGNYADPYQQYCLTG